MQLTRSPRMSEIKDEDFEPIEKDGKLNAPKIGACSEPGTGVLSMASGSSDIGRTTRSSTYLSTSKACRS